MSSRTYLSIGDVLGLLRQEFPDVTISKIRFLESQGLVNPERTPSGYRKFYEHDVERLRWVLRQQREHFLPLKVIKGRLEEDGPDDADGGALAPVPDEVVAPDGRAVDERPARVLAARGAGARLEAGSGHDGGLRTTAEPGAGTTERVTTATAGGAPAGRDSAGRHAVGREPAGRQAVGVATRATPGAQAPGHTAPATRGAVSPGGAPAGAPRVAGGSSTRSVTTPEPAPTHDADAAAMETLSGDAMTAEELASAAGLDVAAVAQLDSYGLVSGRVVGGVTYYERDALDVARLAAGFARYGVEARHLRLHKHAAEREAGFIEQIVLPVLKQRNPEARRRALDTVGELSRLGLGLREALLRRTLRDQLGG